MALSPEWQHRIEHWRRALPRHFYVPLGTVEMHGFTTLEQLTATEALTGCFATLRRSFRPMPPGTPWGAKWEYGWFKGELTLPEAAAGRRIVLRADLGGESLIYVNGRPVGSADKQHTEITLATHGVPGTRYEILAETYAGHGPRVEGVGPVAHGQISVPEPGPTQTVVGITTFGIWNEEVYQLWLDAETLFHIRNNHDPESLRVAEIDRGLRDFTLIVDLELPPDEMMETVRAGRARLQPLLACVNGSTAPTLFTCGHAHLDVAWLWSLAETERKIGRTIANQLALMAEYPEYKYLQSQPHLYHMLKTRYPELYEQVKAAAGAGQLIPEGGMWVEADTNITGGESLIRQLLYGKRFFREEFGVECKLLWLPDVFGYSAALPQIMRGCGINYFATQKIFWTYNGGDPFPYNTFIWEGLDGSQVLAHIFYDYNSETHPAALIGRWRERAQKDGISSMILTFGHGDGGGGPTRNHLEFLRRAQDLEGVPKTRMASPVEFFQDLEARISRARHSESPPRLRRSGRGAWHVQCDLPRYVGELYFQAHRGTYTSQARIKRDNRRSEFALREAEMWGAAAHVLSRLGRGEMGRGEMGRGKPCPYNYDWDALGEAWRTVLLLQFHDILPGSSIHRVYEEAAAGHAAVIETAQGMAQSAAASLIQQQNEVEQAGDAITVFNSLSWERTALIPLPPGWAGAADATGKPLPIQAVGAHGCAPTGAHPGPTGHRSPTGDLAGAGGCAPIGARDRAPTGAHSRAPLLLAEVTVPSCGWSTVHNAPPPPNPEGTPLLPSFGGWDCRTTEHLLENEFLRVEFNERGEITSIFDKETRQELAAGPCNSFKLYKDVPVWFDAWDIDSNYELMPVELDDAATFEVIAEGPLVARLRVSRMLHRSAMTQEISLRRGSRRVEFATTIDWQESHKLLKVAFPVNIHADEAVHEIQFGHLRRPNHRSRPYDASRFEVSNHKWSALVEENRGCAVLNDCKYGLNVLGNVINLTLLKAALAPDMTADRGIQTFTYAFYAWNGSLADSAVVREAYELNCPVLMMPGAAAERSLFAVSAPNVVLETIKLAEDGRAAPCEGSGDVIVRLYEAKRAATRCRLMTTLPVRGAVETDMLENTVGELSCTDDREAPWKGREAPWKSTIELEFRPFEIKTIRLQF